MPRPPMALQVLADYTDIRVLDLAQVVRDAPVMAGWWAGKDVHFWKAREQAALGRAVADAVKAALKSAD